MGQDKQRETALRTFGRVGMPESYLDRYQRIVRRSATRLVLFAPLLLIRILF